MISNCRSQLMSAIYDKALKRKDFSGIVGHNDEKKNETEGKDKKEKKSDVEWKKQRELDVPM